MKAQKRKYTSIYSEQHSKMYQIGKHKDIMAYIDSGFKKFTSIHDTLAIKMNRYLEESNIPKWITKGNTTLIQKDPPNRNRLQQL